MRLYRFLVGDIWFRLYDYQTGKKKWYKCSPSTKRRRNMLRYSIIGEEYHSTWQERLGKNER